MEEEDVAWPRATEKWPRETEAPKRHERVTVDPAVRRRLNGETVAQMEHAAWLKENGAAIGTHDTTVDCEWPVDRSLAGADTYVTLCTVLWLLPKVLLFLPLLTLLCLPFTLRLRTYSCALLPTLTNLVDRRTWHWPLFVAECTLALLLVLPVACLSLLLDELFYLLFGYVYVLATCSFGRWRRSEKVIHPYRHGPSVVWWYTDAIVALLGQVNRHGIWESNYKLALMIVVIPWLKYFINCNPMIYPLEERFTQQISTSCADMDVDAVADAVRTVVCQTKQQSAQQEILDAWMFVPHYAYPPADRRWALGVQAAGHALLGMHLLVHTTHAISDAGGSTEQFVLSNSVEQPVWRVMLWYSNPFHFLTGFVEASISTGEPTQPDKRFGGEHPMWLITSHSPLHTERANCLGIPGPSTVDKFFDFWLPFLVHECRRLVRGEAIADLLREEVVSKAGVSRPLGVKSKRIAAGDTDALLAELGYKDSKP